MPDIKKRMDAAPKKVFWTGRETHSFRTEIYYPGYWDADQLYNLNKDLFEQTNVYEANQAKANEMKAILSEYILDLPHAFGEF